VIIAEYVFGPGLNRIDDGGACGRIGLSRSPRDLAAASSSSRVPRLLGALIGLLAPHPRGLEPARIP
jgi:hypothetical protein